MPVREVEPGPALTPSPVPELPSPARQRKRWIWVVAAVAIVAAAVLLVRLSPSARSAGAGNGIRTAVVQQGDFIRSLRFHGVVEAVESHSIAAPRLSGQGLGTLIITKLIKNGSAVHKGDVLVEFDQQAQLRVVLDKQAEYRDLVEQIKKKQAEQAALRAADETALQQAVDAEKTAELEVKKNEIISAIDAEKNQENLEQARATRKQLQETFDLKRQAATAELKILEIQRDRAQAAVRWAQGNTQKMVIHSDVDGVAVINSMWKANSLSEVQEGDEVRAGFAFMQVVNPSRMQVRARVNQADVAELQAGQAVRIHLDAYPDLAFGGKIESLAAVAQSNAFNSRARNVTVLCFIEGADPKLLPDLSAAVNVQLDRRPNVLMAPRDAVFQENGHSYVMIQNGSGFDKREVNLGPDNDIDVVLNGVDKGAVLLRNPNS